jgi:hypothetical protein
MFARAPLRVDVDPRARIGGIARVGGRLPPRPTSSGVDRDACPRPARALREALRPPTRLRRRAPARARPPRRAGAAATSRRRTLRSDRRPRSADTLHAHMARAQGGHHQCARRLPPRRRATHSGQANQHRLRGCVRHGASERLPPDHAVMAGDDRAGRTDHGASGCGGGRRARVFSKGGGRVPVVTGVGGGSFRGCCAASSFLSPKRHGRAQLRVSSRYELLHHSNAAAWSASRLAAERLAPNVSAPARWPRQWKVQVAESSVDRAP